MCAVAIARERPNEWLRPIFGPHVFENGGVVHCFVSDLGDADGVRGGTTAGLEKVTSLCAVHVALMIGTVDVFPVPAGGEVMDSLEAVVSYNHAI